MVWQGPVIAWHSEKEGREQREIQVKAKNKREDRTKCVGREGTKDGKQ